MIRIEAVFLVLLLILSAVLWTFYMERYSARQLKRDSKQYFPQKLREMSILMDDVNLQIVEAGNDGNNEVQFKEACDKVNVLDSIRITL